MKKENKQLIYQNKKVFLINILGTLFGLNRNGAIALLLL